MIRLAYSRQGAPSARLLRATAPDDIELYESSEERVDVNWGRRRANSELNPDISNAVNKRRMRELFESHGVPMPELYSAFALQLGYTRGNKLEAIGRPDFHSRRQGLWKVSGYSSLMAALHGTRTKRAATHFMEYIDKTRAPREYRVHIFNGRSIRLSEKSFDDSERGYTTVPPTHNVSHVREAAKMAVEAVGLDFGAVDVLANDDECWVLEVNAAPGLGGTMPDVYIRAFKRWKEGLDEAL